MMRPAPPSLILASASPRRRALLEQYGYRFKVRIPAVSEVEGDAFTPRELTICNATRKAFAVAASLPNEVVIAADTVVAIDGDVIGKPRDHAEAKSILKRLSGRAHEVYSSVFICRLSENLKSAFTEISRVQFRRLTSDAIQKYLAAIDPLDKAGAYAAQEAGSEIIEKIEGSFTNVVGLPMERTAIELRRFKIESRRSG